MAQKFETDLLKLIGAELFFLCGMQAAREMFGKSYFSLGAGEKVVVDHAVATAVGSNMRTITTPESLRAGIPQQTQPVGFQAGSAGMPPTPTADQPQPQGPTDKPTA